MRFVFYVEVWFLVGNIDSPSLTPGSYDLIHNSCNFISDVYNLVVTPFPILVH